MIALSIQAMLWRSQTSAVPMIQSLVLRICHIISKDSGYKFCPGLNVAEYYKQYNSATGYNIESVRVWDKHFKCVDSVNCLLWHQISSNVCRNEKICSEVLCRACKRLRADLDHQRSRSDVSPARRLKRQQPSSRFKLKYLSPASTLKCKAAAQKERSNDKAKLSSLTEFDVTLEDDQSDEVIDIIKRIKQDCPDELQSAFEEADGHSSVTGKSLELHGNVTK